MTWGAIGGAAVATIGGALLGSKGSQSSTEQQKTLDPRMVPYLFGGNGQTGLLQYGQQAMDRSQSPQRLQDWQNIRDRGMGLLGGSVAGNPFAQVGGYQGGAGMGALGGAAALIPRTTFPQSAPVTPMQQNPMQPGPTMDQIMAELQRRQQMQAMLGMYGAGFAGGDANGSATGGSPGGGVGNNANGDSAGVGAGPM